MNRRVIASAVCVFSMLVGVTSVASAAPLAPGGTVDPVPFSTSAGDPSLDGVIIASVVSPFVGLDVNNVVRFSGVLQSHVVRETASNRLSFYYQISNELNSLDAISQFTDTSFSGWATDVIQRTDAMAGIPLGSANIGNRPVSYATRGGGLGSDVTFTLIAAPIGAGTLAQGETSLWHVIRTNALDYTLGNTAIINGGNVNVQTFAPIPEPATMGLVALGAVALLRRRR